MIMWWKGYKIYLGPPKLVIVRNFNTMQVECPLKFLLGPWFGLWMPCSLMPHA